MNVFVNNAGLIVENNSALFTERTYLSHVFNEKSSRIAVWGIILKYTGIFLKVIYLMEFKFAWLSTAGVMIDILVQLQLNLCEFYLKEKKITVKYSIEYIHIMS